jgi:hypothetical protein
MRRTPLAAATLLIAATCLTGATATKRAVLPPPLLPLSEKDMRSTDDTGCETSISQGDDTFIFIIGNSFILRTAPGAAGLQICHPTDAMNFDTGGGPVTCGGRKLSMRHVGKSVGHEEADSVEGSGILTMSDATHSRQVKVSWGTAC